MKQSTTLMAMDLIYGFVSLTFVLALFYVARAYGYFNSNSFAQWELYFIPVAILARPIFAIGLAGFIQKLWTLTKNGKEAPST